MSVHDDHGDRQERGEDAQRRGEAQVERLRRALAEHTLQAEEARRERREATRSLRRGAP